MQQRLFIITFICLGFFSVQAQQGTSWFASNGVAIRGYDPVAYFKDAKPVKGDSTYQFQWQGINWWFSQQAYLDSFKLNPEHYAPQYGGYCAYGASESHLAPTSPEAWTIVDDKLYLNYSPKVKSFWTKDIPGRITAANAYWLTLQTPKKQ